MEIVGIDGAGKTTVVRQVCGSLGATPRKAALKHAVHEHTGRSFPDDPREQLELAVRAVFDSWNTPRARLYRRREDIPDDLGTAVTVMAMVFGNLDDRSGTGVAFTRDPGSGAPELRRLLGVRAG